MGAAAGGIASVTSIASLGLSAVGAVEKGEGQKAADDYQAARADQAAQYGETQAAQTDANMREKLNVTLGNIDAVRAASGVDPSSPTTAALRQQTTFYSDQQRSTSVDNILEQSTQDTNDAAYYRSAGSFALNMGDLSAGTSLLSGVSKMASGRLPA